MYWELSQQDFVFQKFSLVSVSETSFKEMKQRKKKVCQNAHLHYFTHKAPTFTSWGFVIT